MPQPLLSILLPSHNSAMLVEEAVRSILDDPAFEAGRVELCISDNSPSDETATMLGPILAGRTDCRYRRSLDSPSLDENLRTAANMATGEYIWFFGDDDLLCRGALSSLLKALEPQDAEIVIVNSTSFDHHGTVEPLRVVRTEDALYSQADDEVFLRELGSYVTYACAIVIAKQRWDACYASECVGTMFAHLATLLRAKHGTVAKFHARPTIAMRLHRQTWLSRHFQVWNEFFPRAIWSVEGYSDDAKASVISRDPARSIARLAASRAYGRFNRQIYDEMIGTRRDYGGMRRMAALLISEVPEAIMRRLYIAYIQVFRRRQKESFSPLLALAHLRRG